jgi:hypothetical protein
MKRQTKTTGQLINKVEGALAIAMMNGDKVMVAKWTKALEAAINGTQMPDFVA